MTSLAGLGLVSIAMALSCMPVHAVQPTLTPAETANWMAVGQRCEAPVARIRGRDGTFEIYVESPAARAAVVAATATVKHVPLAAAGVKSALKSGYRIWVVNTDRSTSSPTVNRIAVLADKGPEMQPVDVRRERLFLGTIDSHGIIEPLRRRFQEFTFPILPAGTLTVVLHMASGVQRYRITEADRARLIRVCNE